MRTIHTYRDDAAIMPFAERIFTWEEAIRVLRKRGRFIVVVVSVLTLGTVVAAVSMKNVYQPTARIEIDPLESGITTLHEIEYSNGPPDSDYLQTQAQILQSDALAMRVVRTLHLDSRPEFVSTRVPVFPKEEQPRAAVNNAKDTSVNQLNEQFDLAERTPHESIALAALQHDLSVNPIRNSRLIEVGYASTDPALAQLITNTVVTQFIEQNYRNRYASTMEASEWLSAQLSDLRRKVQESSRAVADYQQRYGFVEANDYDIPQSQLMSEVNHQLSTAQADRIEAEAYARMIDLGQADTLPALRDDQVYQNVTTRYADVRAQLAQARTIYGDENSNVRKLEGEANELAAQVDAERARVANRIRTSFEAARAREQMMLQSRDKLRADMGRASSHLMEYQLLKNEAVANAELYNTLQGRLQEAGIYAGLRSSNIHVIDLAPKLMTPTGPHRRFVIAIGSVASILIALVLAFAQESFENTIRTPDDIREWVGLPSLAMLPRVQANRSSRKPLTDTHGSKGAHAFLDLPIYRLMPIQQLSESEGMRGLRTSLFALFAQSAVSPRVVLVSSSLEGEGKTTVAVNLAAAFAQRGRRCLLIDGDLRRRQITDIFGLNFAPGLTEVLSGQRNAESTIAETQRVPDLSILPSGNTETDPTELLCADRVQALLRAVKDRFDAIVIDSPPVIPFCDARLLAIVSTAVVFVGRYGFTTRRAIARGVELLTEVRAPIAGIVLNGIDLGSADYHYYNYGFSKSLIHGVDEPSIGPTAQKLVTSAGASQDRESADEGSEASSKAKGAHT